VKIPNTLKAFVLVFKSTYLCAFSNSLAHRVSIYTLQQTTTGSGSICELTCLQDDYSNPQVGKLAFP